MNTYVCKAYIDKDDDAPFLRSEARQYLNPTHALAAFRDELRVHKQDHLPTFYTIEQMNTKSLKFSIERWQELVVNKGTHLVKIEDGPIGRILCTDYLIQSGPAILFSHLNKREYETTRLFFQNGTSIQQTENKPLPLIIIPKPPKSLGWMNVWKSPNADAVICTNPHGTKEVADAQISCGNGWVRLACVEIFEGDGLDV